MAFQFSVAARNAAIDAIETTIGTAPTLEIRSGSVPANAAAADSGTLLASMTLPSDWLAAASSGSKTLLGTWQDASADATGTAGHFRIKVSGTCHIQGTVTATGGGGDMTLDNTSIASGQQVTITSFTLTAGGA
ncbi:hypothetical protein G5V65_21040 [Rhodobacter sp. HX-7-19]|uniref:Uncharacterized protein n=1 Tax=Paragemmobacter kunshanensis TaxID=2583234 RepID=A0A6M1U322_9RHOB|nr:hypothetical protein [Rhodobacter kunshanensis]NGQ93376.1 hypothetical protein [Rhodobacter kunshanensis]